MMKSCNIFVHNEAEFLVRSELLSVLTINIDIKFAVTDHCSQLAYVNVGLFVVFSQGEILKLIMHEL